MPKKPLPPEVVELIQTYQKAQVSLINIIATQEARGNVTAYRKAILTSVNQELATLNKYAEGWAEKVIPEAYKTGAAATYAAFRKANIDVGKVQINQRVVDTLVRNTVGQLEDATAFVGRRIADDVRKAGLEAIAEKVSTGSTVKQAKENLLSKLTENGITAIRDKNGREINLDAYASTVARTTTREATNKAALQTAQDLGSDLVQISQHFSACPVCAVYEGRVYSISGESKDYPPLDEAFSGGYSTIHPNCFIDSQTPIFTSKGWIEIGKIQVGDLVLSHKGKFRKVTQLHRNMGRPDIVKISARIAKDSFSNLTITSGHPIMLNGEWQDAKNAKAGDAIRVLSHKCENCGKDIPLYKTHCDRKCAMETVYKKRDTKEWRDNLSKSCKKATQKRYDDGDIDRFAITHNANIKTRQMLKDGTHPFNDIEVIKKGQRTLGAKHYGKTWLEEKMGWYLTEKLGIDVECQYPIEKSIDSMGRQRYYFADFAIKGHKIIIECDGENWHKDIEADAERQKFIESQGYTVLRFTGKEIKENLEACGQEILRVLANHNDEYTFIDIPIKTVTIHKARRTYALFNLSVDKDESYIAKGYVVHNCDHVAVPYFPEFDPNAEQLKIDSNEPFELDPAKKKSIDAYNKGQDIKAKLRADRDEWLKARSAAPNETPKTLSAYKAVKKADNERYQTIKEALSI